MRSLRETGRWIRSRWLVGVAIVVLIAFIAGLAFGLSGTDRTIAQEGSTDLPPPPPHLVATPDGPVPTVDRTKRPLIFETVPYTPPVGYMEAKSDAGSSAKPATGNYLYLWSIDRYYSLPDDVKLVDRIDFMTCDPETRCPVAPFRIYQRGEARIGIDQLGEIFDDIEGGDASAFPFFTGKEDHEDRTAAQEGSTDLPPPPPHLVATPDGPVPTMDLTKYPIIAETVPYTPHVGYMEAKTTAGSSTKPATGNYLYLPAIDRYFSLPDDVKFDGMIQLGTCVPLTPEEMPCPVFPLRFYQRGEARIAIDSVGQIFEDIEGGGDASAFPFFTGEVSNAEHNSLEPLLRRYDANDNGMIDKDEAVAAVLDYFAGLIPKDEALAVVAAHTSH